MTDLYTLTFPNPNYRPAPSDIRTPTHRRANWACVAIVLIGCATVAPVVTDHGPELRAPVAQLKRDLPIETAPKKIMADVAAIDTAIDNFVVADDQYQADVIAAKKSLTDEQAKWWSYRQRRLGWWLVGGFTTIVIGIAVTSFFSGGATGAAALGFFGHLASGIFTGGLHLFQLLFQKIGAAFHHAPTIAVNLVKAQTKAAAKPLVIG